MTTTNKKLKIIVKINNKTYQISSKTWELMSELFKISILEPKEPIIKELRAYRGVGKKENQLLARALAKPINYPIWK